MTASDQQVPPHIPAELVRDVALEDLPGGDRDPHTAITTLHEGPDIVWSPRGRRGKPHWIVTRHELMVELMRDTETFSNQGEAGFSQLLGESWDLIPLEKDGAEHAMYRRLMNPLFSPKRINEIGDRVTTTAESLVRELRPLGECEFVEAFSKPFPVMVFLELLGLPLDEMPLFLRWEEHLLHSKTMAERVSAAHGIKAYLVDVISRRREQPVDDLISVVVHSELEGRPLDDTEILSICFMLFVGGLDTVANKLGFMFKFLAENPAAQQALRENPERIPGAAEELLRAHAIIVPLRVLKRDVEFHGVLMKAGEHVAVPLALAGRDERVFECPHQVDFERQRNPHISFSSGPHRCIGSHLARREIKIALELWLSHVPPFRVKEGAEPRTHTTAVFGVDYLPLVWD